MSAIIAHAVVDILKMRPTDVLVMLAGIPIALAVHEAGHAAAAETFGIDWKFVVTWRGPALRHGRDDENTPVEARIGIALAGPAASLVAAAAFWRISPWLSCASIDLGVLNLIPVSRTDARHALAAFLEVLPRQRRRSRNIRRSSRWYGRSSS